MAIEPLVPLLDEFDGFLDDEVEPATAELKKLADAQRIHLQRLVYTNVVDRFDTLVDLLILELTSLPSSNLRDELLAEMDAPVTEGALIKNAIAASKNDFSFAFERLKEQARLTVLRQRHSKKLEKLCALVLGASQNLRKPRVNDNDGRIFTERKANFFVPLSIIGYADWLYSKRNAIVHGGAQRNVLLEHDHQYIARTFKEAKTPRKKFQLKIASISSTATYYKSLTYLLRQAPSGTPVAA